MIYQYSIFIHVSQLHLIIGHIKNELSCWTELLDIMKRYNVNNNNNNISLMSNIQCT